MNISVNENGITIQKLFKSVTLSYSEIKSIVNKDGYTYINTRYGDVYKYRESRDVLGTYIYLTESFPEIYEHIENYNIEFKDENLLADDQELYSFDKVKKMVEKEKEKHGWEFLFLGANIDAIEVAGRFGIGANRAINYECDREGTALNYKVLSETVSAVRRSKSRVEMDEAVVVCCAPIREDYQRRHKS